MLYHLITLFIYLLVSDKMHKSKFIYNITVGSDIQYKLLNC